MNQPGSPLRTSTGGDPPFPSVGTAFLLTFGAILAGGLVGMLFIELGPLAAEGIGTAVGIGGVATLAARRVAEPQATRIGLIALDWRAWPLILCFVPAVLIASELDNFAYDWSPRTEVSADATGTGETATQEVRAAATPTGKATETDTEAAKPPIAAAEQPADSAAKPESKTERSDADPAKPAAETEPPVPLIDSDDPFSLMEGVIVAVGIAPVIHEFLFRGVLQQGLVAQLGILRGVTLTALLWTMLRPVPAATPARFAASFVAWFAMGWLLGMVRIATGSILGSTLLASLWAAVGFASFALEGRVDVPGMNVEGTHLPVAVTVASVAIVAWAGMKVLEKADASSSGTAG